MSTRVASFGNPADFPVESSQWDQCNPSFCLTIYRSVGKAAASARGRGMLRYGPIDRATSERTRAGGPMTGSEKSKGCRHCVYASSQSQHSGKSPKKRCSRVFANRRRHPQGPGKFPPRIENKKYYQGMNPSPSSSTVDWPRLETSDAAGDGSTRARVQGTFFLRRNGRAEKERAMRYGKGNEKIGSLRHCQRSGCRRSKGKDEAIGGMGGVEWLR